MALLPEDHVLPEVYYSEERAKQYDQNTRIRKIQREMTLRALEILEVRPPAIFLDVGCGTGLSMQVLKEKGFEGKGIDIAEPMLSIARQKGLDVRKANFTIKIPWESNYFDYIISISTLQWIFHGFRPEVILEKGKKTAAEIYRVLKPEGRAIIQFYPKNKEQFELAGRLFRKAKFQVMKIIDDPNIPKRRKTFLLCVK
ncbi:MAG: class I SAM-dependent methyltransferase [Candidatus Helarchaeota archaeon]|nr:class I SAM-dependent methyltransferase [Candidatus Helarchaeota archaeon]